MMHHYSPVDESIELLGAADVERNGDSIVPLRVLSRLRHQFPTEYSLFVSENAAGSRLRFATAANRVEIALDLHRTGYVGQPPFPAAVDLVTDGRVNTCAVEGGVAVIDHLTGSVSYEDGETQRAVFDGLGSEERVVELWLPHTARVRIIEIATDAPIRRAPLNSSTRWVHYGSSISHSGLSASPTLTWPAVAARKLGWDGTNLGLSGNAMLDPFSARTIATLPADLITLKVGINLINYDSMTLRTFIPALHGFLDTIRESHPTTPIVLISPTAFAPAEHTPGPTSVDMETFRGIAWTGTDVHGADALTQARIRTAMGDVIAARHDDALLYLDGRQLFSEDDDAAGLSADGLHPNQDGTVLMGERFPALIRELTHL